MRMGKAEIFGLAVAGTLSAVLGGLVGARNAALGQTSDQPPDYIWTYEWTAPTTGAPVAWYLVEYVVDARDTTRLDRIGESRVAIGVYKGHDYTVRVRAYDASNRGGPWSNWSAPFRELCEADEPTNTSGN